MFFILFLRIFWEFMNGSVFVQFNGKKKKKNSKALVAHARWIF